MADGVVQRDMLLEQTPSGGAGPQEGRVQVNGKHGATVSAQETISDLEDKQAHGAAVHSFDSDATPEQKKAQALKGAADKLAPLSDRLLEKRHGGSEVATDIGGKDVVPTINIADVQKASEEEKGRKDTHGSGQAAIPGGLKEEIAAAIPEWYRVGWRAQSQALLDAGGDIELARQRDILSEFLSENYFGGWYHNSAIVFFAVFSSYYIARFDMGWGWLLVILTICTTYYRTSMRRVRHRARDDITRQLSKQRLFTDHETVDWMNEFLHRFWLAYEPILSATIVATVDQTLSYSAPPGVDSMRMTTFTLGTKSPRIDFIRTHPGTDTDVVVMDWKISFTPNDVSDMTTRQAADKVNPKIVLAIKFGKGKVALTKDIVVEDVAFTGLMRIRLKLMNNFPHVQTIDLSFLEQPHIDYAAKPVGFDLAMIPGLENFINSQIHATLGPMMYDPNTFVIDLQQLLSSAPIDTAVGVLHITVNNARNLKGVKFGGGLPDPYISFGIGAKTGLARTKIKHSSVNPHWNEGKFLLVNSLSDILSMEVLDYNDKRKDSVMGTASFDLKLLQDDAEQEDLSAPVMLAGKPRGTVNFEVKFFPVLTPKKLADGTEEPVPESKTGIVRVTLHQAKELDSRRTGNECNPYARIYLRGQPILKTSTFKRNHNPMWESSTEFLVTSKNDAVIGVKVIDNKGFASDPTIGFVNVKLNDILTANANQQDWFPLSGCASGRIRMSATFRPVAMAGAVNSANDFRPPIGVVRIHIKKAIDLKNVEGLTGGKSDPYIRIVRSGLVVARTLVMNNNLDPEFDEIVYAPVHSLSDVLTLEAMDYQTNTKDRPLGQATLDVRSLASEGPDRKERPYESLGSVERTDKLVVDGGRSMKGTLVYEAKFYPTTPIKGVQFEKTASPLDSIRPRGANIDDDGASFLEPDVDDTATVDGDDALTRQMEAEAIAVQSKAADTPGPYATGQMKSMDSVTSFGTALTAETVDGVHMSREEVLRSQSGILVFDIVSGNLAKKGARLEVAFDDAYWPSYSTEVARTKHQTWDEVGEAFIREMAYSRIILRLNEADKDSREDIQADFRTSLAEFLEQCLDKPAEFMLTNDQGGNRSTVTISAKYVPVPIQLEMRETVNNCGIIRVDLLEGSGLKAADRNGKSDPYCVFQLNGQKVFESSVQKKTLNPKWNEKFEMLVPSRVAAQLKLKVYDWDRVGASDKLGSAIIDVSDIEPFEASTKTVTIVENGQEAGTVTLRMVFRPEFVARTRAATSTFVGHIAGNAAHGVGTVAGTGVHIVGKGGKLALGGAGLVAGGAGAVGKGVFSGVKHVIPGGHSRKDTMTSLATNDSSAEGPYAAGNASMASLPQGAAPTQVAGNGINGKVQLQPVGGSPDFGVLQIQLDDFAGLSEPEKLYCVVKHGSKSLDKARNASSSNAFSINTTPDTMSLSVAVYHKRFGKDKELGSSDLDVWSHIQPGMRNAANVVLPIAGGSVSATLSWTPAASSPSAVQPSASAAQNAASDSPVSVKSRSRFSMHKSRQPT